jgi:hypothetical protein
MPGKNGLLMQAVFLNGVGWSAFAQAVPCCQSHGIHGQAARAGIF